LPDWRALRSGLKRRNITEDEVKRLAWALEQQGLAD
jgi:hypothetical protein